MNEKTNSNGRLLVFACDGGYAMPLATALRSVVESNRAHWPVEVCVLSSGIPEPLRNRVLQSLPEGSAHILWTTVDLSRCEQFSTLPHISKSTFARLLIPSVVPPSVSRVLYLDADLLVLADLEPMWSADLNGAPVGAVVDDMDAMLKRGDPGWEGVPRVRDYFNAGVLLMDLERWRSAQVSERAFEYLSRHPDSPRADQDALNVACDGNWKQLDRRWNFPCFRGVNLAALEPAHRPAIAHFITKQKPWDARFRSVNAGFYDAFRSRTRFARTTGEKARDAVAAFGAGVQNVLRRRGLLPSIEEQPMPARRA